MNAFFLHTLPHTGTTLLAVILNQHPKIIYVHNEVLRRKGVLELIKRFSNRGTLNRFDLAEIMASLKVLCDGQNAENVYMFQWHAGIGPFAIPNVSSELDWMSYVILRAKELAFPVINSFRHPVLTIVSFLRRNPWLNRSDLKKKLVTGYKVFATYHALHEEQIFKIPVDKFVRAKPETRIALFNRFLSTIGLELTAEMVSLITKWHFQGSLSPNVDPIIWRCLTDNELKEQISCFAAAAHAWQDRSVPKMICPLFVREVLDEFESLNLKPFFHEMGYQWQE